MPSRDPLTKGEKRKLSRLRSDLLAWASTNGRSFPWRSKEAGDYEMIVAEVLLQRTTATAVANFFDAFTEKYPGWNDLAAAHTADLEQFLRPLGLWRRRSVSLLGIAHYASVHGGQFPEIAEEHRDIPAVGQYVSNAILMFQHSQAKPLLDVNMARVIERFIRHRRLADIRHDPWLREAAAWLVRSGDSSEVNWAVLDFAALVCRSRTPRCLTCPVRTRCTYFRSIQQSVSTPRRKVLR
tara:strand:- start:15583 stop:16299 length:717 start_codon:yes stop_codon:yes gene_type:complete